MNNGNKFEIFGNYLLLRKLAEGGMAEVYLARPASSDGNGRLQVLKRILPHIGNHSEFLGMFQREIQIIMGFTHANVVQLHDFGAIGGRPYIVMEYIEGKNLRDITEKLKSKNFKVPVPMALSLIAQAASGLHYAHTFVNRVSGEKLNIVHRDISPHNLIVSYDGNLKVIDFGIAKAACSLQDLTRTGTVKGKAAYFSPEQVSGHKVDARTDIFALGTVAWELLTGERLFARTGDSEVTAMSRVCNCEKHVLAPSTINKEVPVEVDSIIMTALEKDPRNRYADARQLQSAIRQVLIKLFPTYTYAETGRLLSAIFADELAKERAEMRDLNLVAQNSLVGDMEGKTVAISKTRTNLTTQSAMAAYNHEHSKEAQVDFRLSKIEDMLKQKATTRHYVMLAFYVLSLFALKIMENYEFSIDVSAQNAKATEMAAIPSPIPEAAAMPAPVQEVKRPRRQQVPQSAVQRTVHRRKIPATTVYSNRQNNNGRKTNQPVTSKPAPTKKRVASAARKPAKAAPAKSKAKRKPAGKKSRP